MDVFRTYAMNHSTILRINSEKNKILTEPEYQRNGEVWNTEKKQLLIDSILNEYDIPKIYFHVLQNKKRIVKGKEYSYSIIDGRQRLEAIWSFINGDFPLDSNFKYFKDSKVDARGLTYADVGKHYPDLKILFDSFVLPIILVETDDTDYIEDMFSRLNEAVPLNAAEKRNAFGGAMAKLINQISKHNLFTDCVRFSNSRYQHKEVAGKILYIENMMQVYKDITTDIGKVYLDEFVKKFKKDPTLSTTSIEKECVLMLDKMKSVFSKKDPLLSSQSFIPLYYLLFREQAKGTYSKTISRSILLNFRRASKKNKQIAEKDITKANFDLLEFDRLSQQGTNDRTSILERLRILKKYL